MPKLDLTFSITAVIAVCALLSPILTAIINNRYHLKLKRIELEQLEKETHIAYKRNIFENYLKCAGMCVQHPNKDAMMKYGESYFLAYAHAPEPIRIKMTQIDRYIAQPDQNSAILELESLSKLIASLLQKL